jgi:hypothetical protein
MKHFVNIIRSTTLYYISLWIDVLANENTSVHSLAFSDTSICTQINDVSIYITPQLIITTRKHDSKGSNEALTDSLLSFIINM